MPPLFYVVEQSKHCFDYQILPQLNKLYRVLKNDQSFTMDDKGFRTFLEQENNMHIVLAKESHRHTIIRMGTIFIRYLLEEKGNVAYVDSVAVLPEWQGKGVAPCIDKELKKIAQKKHASHIDLTSNPARVRANRFYQKQGYELRDTNVYRFILPRESVPLS